MLEYAKFLCKRILRIKSNMIMVISIMVIVAVCFVMNIKTQERFPEMLKSQIHTDMEQMDLYQSKLKNAPQNSEEYESYVATIQYAQTSIKIYQQLLDDVHHGNWSKVYSEYSDVLESRIALLKNNMSEENEEADKDEISNSFQQLTYIRYLKEHHLDYEEQDFPIYGLSFTTSIAQFILPPLITIACVYLLAQLFTMDYAKNLDISTLYPLSRGKILSTKLLIGMGISILIFTLIVLFSFLLATLFNLNAGWQYPILMREQSTGLWGTITTFTLLKEWLPLGILFCVCLTLFTYIVSLFIREDVYLLLLVLGIVLGISYMPMLIGEMKAIAHILPTTYMNFVNVAKGSVAKQYMNADITTTTGMRVLGISILIQFVICVLYTVIGQPKKKKRTSSFI